MRTALLCLTSATLAVGVTLSLATPAEAPARSPEAILSSYVEDFRSDRAAATARTFGVRVDDDAWTVAVSGKQESDGTFDVELSRGAPRGATFVYTIDAATLAAIDAGELNALTAQGKAFPGDPTPLAIEWMEGAQKVDVNAFSFHFWTRGFPEKVPFGPELGRTVHGARNVVFYYQPGFRSAWTSLAQGERADNGPGQPIMIPFPIMIIATAGRTKGKVDGQLVEAKAGEMIFIPPMTPYEWWNEDEELAEAILVMFGEGA